MSDMPDLWIADCPDDGDAGESMVDTLPKPGWLHYVPASRLASAHLSPVELVDLTGRRQRSKQVEWLRENRWRFTIRADGLIRVARDYWRARLVGDVEAPAANDAAPDFAAVAR